MVCSIGGGKMTVMARVLAAESYSQNIPAEAGNQRLICNYIHRELFEGNEANLLDEEDMNVYGLMPMEDPLHLVCCNACKKPVKASQYTAHAELCRLLRFEETILEIDGSAGHTKCSRRERKKLLRTHAYENKISRKHETSKSVKGAVSLASEFHLDEQVGKTNLFAMDAQNVGPKVVYSGVGPGFTNFLAGVVPPTKRIKLISAERLAQSGHPETESGVTKNTSPEASTSRDFPKGSTAGVGKCSNHVRKCCLPTKDIPVPLATKVYYSQRSHYLRSTVSRMYHGPYAEEYCSDFATQDISQGDLPQQTSSPNNILSEQIMNGQHGKKLDNQSSPSVPNPDRPQSSEPLIDDEGSSPVNNSAKHFPVNNMTRPNTALRIKYCSKGYSFAGNSGTSLGTKKQPNGSVPVT